MPTILIIDDNEEIRTLWTEVLEEEGHEVIQAESGVVGVKIAQTRGLDVIVRSSSTNSAAARFSEAPSFKLIESDGHLPDCQGQQARA